MKARFSLPACVFLLSILPTYAQLTHAQEIRYKFQDEVVVTGTRTPKTLADTPVKTEVVQKKEIEELHYKSLDEVVPQLPGVTVISNTRRAGESAVIQGLGEDHVLVLVDGVPQMQTSSYGFDLSQVSAEEIQSVEVVKGGSSALYGSQAMGGVINVITRKPEEKTRVSLDLEAGRAAISSSKESFEDPIGLNVSSSVTGKINSIGYKVQASGRSQEGYDRDSSTISEDVPSSRKLNGNLYLDYQAWEQAQLWAQYRIYNEKIESIGGIPSTSFGVEERRNRADLIQHGLTVGGKKTFSDTRRLSAFSFYEISKDHLILGDNPRTDFIESEKNSEHHRLRSELQWDDLYGDRHLVTMGMAHTYTYLDQENFNSSSSGKIENKEVDSQSHSSVEAYIQDDILLNRWEVVPGLRVQNDKNYGTHFSPKTSLRYALVEGDVTASNLRASVGSGYRVPSLKERYYILDHRSLDNYIVLGNEGLRPEASVSYQFGWDYQQKAGRSLYLNGFVNDVKDLINTEMTLDQITSVTTHKYQNIGRVRIRGVEAQWKEPIGNFGLTTETSYTYSEARIGGSDKRVPFRPLSVGRLALRWSSKSEMVSILGIYNYQSDQYVDSQNLLKSPSFGTMDLKMNYRFSNSTAVYLGVDNISDVKRPAANDSQSSIDQSPIEGRFFYVGFKINT